MAGSVDSSSQCMPLSTTVISQFSVEYAQFVRYPSLSSLSSPPPHPQLLPHSAYFRKRFRGFPGGWLKSENPDVFVTLLPNQYDTILLVHHRYKILEEHYVSRLHFSWPQVTCISGFPARGTRALVLSYRDGENQIQKFAFRFSTTHEADRFISALKETLEDTMPEVSNAEFGSGVSSQQEFDPSNCPSYLSIDASWRSELSVDSSSRYIPTTTDHEATQASKPEVSFAKFGSDVSTQQESDPSNCPSYISLGESWRSELSLDSSSHYIPTTIDHEAAQTSNVHGLLLNNKAEEIISTFPPSFTSFLMNCCPTAEQGATKPTNTEEAEFKNQLMKYMKDPSFQDILVKAEQLIAEMGDDMQFP